MWQYTYLLELQRHLLLVHRGEWDAAAAGLRELVDRPPGTGDVRRRQPCPPRPTARPPWPAPGRRADRAGLATVPATARAARAGPRRSGPRRVGVAHRYPGRGPRGGRGAGAAHVVGGVGTHARGALRYLARAGRSRPSRSRAVPRGSPPGCGATGGRRRPSGNARAIPTSGRWSWPPPARSSRCWRRWGCWRTSGPPPRPPWSGAGSASWEPAPHGAARPYQGEPRRADRPPARVLALVGEGATNAEIADRLELSVRTVDHHVSAILRLGARTRRDASRRIASLGLAGQDAAGLRGVVNIPGSAGVLTA